RRTETLGLQVKLDYFTLANGDGPVIRMSGLGDAAIDDRREADFLPWGDGSLRLVGEVFRQVVNVEAERIGALAADFDTVDVVGRCIGRQVDRDGARRQSLPAQRQ